jgi:thiamine-phosphate diphosphorylase
MSRPVLHVLTDPGLSRGRSHADVARAALAGGADVIQLRDKSASPDGLREAGREVAETVRAAGALLVVNDSLELARFLGADGLHLGPEDLPLEEARREWAGILGASVRTVEAARRAAAAGADYLGVGPVFGTATKPDAPGAIGAARVAEIAAAVTVPVIGIGGIAAGNAAQVIRAGAAGVAVIAAIVAATDVEEAARALRRALDSAAGSAA